MQKIKIMIQVLIGMHTSLKKQIFFIFFKTLLYLKKIYLNMKKTILLLLDIFCHLNKIGGRKFEKTRKNIQKRIHDLFKKKVKQKS